MKNKMKLSLAVAVTLLTSSAFADSWTLTQDTELDSDTNIKQAEASSNSVQTLNGVNMGAASVIESVTTQTVDMAGLELTLTQEGSTTTSTQAANYIKAESIGDELGAVRQEHLSGGGAIILNQTTSGSANVQAVNVAKALTIVDLTQTVTGAEDVKLNQTATDTNNIQAVNTASGAVTNLFQEVSPTNTLDMDQTNGSNTQAANHLDAGNNDGRIEQNIIDTLTITMDQRASGNAVQAGNMVKATADINDLLQEIDGDTITLTQSGASNNGIQAGNLLDASDENANIVDATQYLTVDSLILGQSGTKKALQASNVLLTGGNGFVAQEITISSLAMTQTSALGSFQAANYAGIKPQ